MIESGKLDTPIEIQELAQTGKDDYGTPATEYKRVPGSPQWAQYMPLRGPEQIENQKRTANITFKLRIRRWEGLSPVYRVHVKSMDADITAIEDSGRDGDMVLWCEVKQ